MGSLRPAALALAGVSLVAACGGGPTAAPSPASSPPVPASTTPRSQAASPTASPSASASPSPSAVTTGQGSVSAAWRLSATATLAGSAALLDVAATGPRDAWAVGYQLSAEDREGAPAVVHWDGTRWREVPGLTDRDAYHLEGVSASGPGDAWVVGNGVNAFAAHWDGRRWTGQRPFGVAEDYRLTDVAVSGDRAWFTGNGPSGAVLLKWEGTEFDTALNSGGALEAVTAKEGHVWAVGSSQEHTPLVWHGFSGGWENPETPAIPGGTLRRVWQVSPSDVWAVGEITGGRTDGSRGSAAQPLVLHWDGARWARVEVPVPRGTLHGVTAFGRDDLWVSGIDADHAGQVLFLHFDGEAWSREYGPLLRSHRPDQQYEETDDVNHTGIARVPGGDALWAVGSVGVGDDEDDFVLRR